MYVEKQRKCTDHEYCSAMPLLTLHLQPIKVKDKKALHLLLSYTKLKAKATGMMWIFEQRRKSR